MRRLVAAIVALAALGGFLCANVFPQRAAYDSIFAIQDQGNNFHPLTARNLAFDPSSRTLQLLFSPEYDNPERIQRLYWASSTDGGRSWSQVGPIDLGLGEPQQPLWACLATSADGTPYAVWVERKYSTKRGVFFSRDEGYGVGLWRQPKLLSDTTAAAVLTPVIDVSGDGDTVLAVWEAGGDIWFTRSLDGGQTFEAARVIMSKNDPVFPQIDNQRLQGSSIALGQNGYVFVLCMYLKAGVTFFANNHPCYVSSGDYGATWSSPKVIPAPSPGYVAHAWPTYNGGVVLVDNLPHFPWHWASDINDQMSIRAYEGHLDAQGDVTWTQISRDKNICFSTWTQGGFSSLGVDANGWLYFLYQDLYIPGYWIVSLRASKDGGATWSERMPLVTLEDQIWAPEIAENVGEEIHWIGTHGGSWTFTPATTIVHGRVAADSVWRYVPPPPEFSDPTKTGGYTYEDSDAPGGPPFRWVEIKDKGTRILDSEWYDPATPGIPNKDDGSAGPYAIGFPFPFFGEEKDSVWIGVNGAFSFAGHDYFYTGASIPGAPIDDLVAVFWEDLYLDSAYVTPSVWGHGDVYYWRNAAGDSFIVEWYKLQTAEGVQDSLVTFQAILARSDSSLTFQYLSVGTAGAETLAVVGVQPKAHGEIGLRYVAGCPLENIVHNGLAVKILPGAATSVEKGAVPSVPAHFELFMNYPNPFNPQTLITYAVPRTCHVELAILNVVGQKVRTLVSGRKSPGHHSALWDGRSDAGALVPAGVYFCRLDARSGGETKGSVAVRKMLLVR